MQHRSEVPDDVEVQPAMGVGGDPVGEQLGEAQLLGLLGLVDERAVTDDQHALHIRASAVQPSHRDPASGGRAPSSDHVARS